MVFSQLHARSIYHILLNARIFLIYLKNLKPPFPRGQESGLNSGFIDTRFRGYGGICGSK
jgi:hypothetical protein